MSDETKPQDSAAMPPASAGSVANHSAFPNSWIPVAERLPDLEGDDGGTPNVLGYYQDYPPDIQLVWYTGNGWEDGDGSGRDVKAPSHWMPLPAPPSDGK